MAARTVIHVTHRAAAAGSGRLLALDAGRLSPSPAAQAAGPHYPELAVTT
jgi:hypothetical protein